MEKNNPLYDMYNKGYVPNTTPTFGTPVTPVKPVTTTTTTTTPATPVTPVTPATPVTLPTMENVYGKDQLKALNEQDTFNENPDLYLEKQGITKSQYQRQALDEMQASIDASNNAYAQKLNQQRVFGTAQLGAKSSAEANRGTIGGNVATASIDTQTRENLQKEADIEQERILAENAIRAKANEIGTQRYEAIKSARSSNLPAYIENIKQRQSLAKTGADTGADWLIQNGYDPASISKSALDEYATGNGTTRQAILDSYAAKQYAASQAEKKRKQDLMAKAPETIETAQGIMMWNPATGKYEKTGYSKYEKPTKSSQSGVTKGDGTGGDFSGLSSQAQTYLNMIKRGESSIGNIKDLIGSTKDRAWLRDEVSTAYDKFVGGAEGSRLLSPIERTDLGFAVTALDNIDPAMYGSIDTKGGLISGLFNPTSEANLENLLGKLTLEKRSLLKGSGAISDKENQMLANSVSILQNRRISEKAAKDELQNIKNVLQGKIDVYDIQTSKNKANNTPAPTSQQNNLRSKYNY